MRFWQVILLIACLTVWLGSSVPLPLALQKKQIAEHFTDSDRSVLESTKSDQDIHSNHNDHSCEVSGDNVRQVFDELTEELEITELNGTVCSHHVLSKSFGLSLQTSLNITCDELYSFASLMLLRLNVTDECCLVNGTACHHHEHVVTKATIAEVYGYGFLMILAVSSCALLGVLMIPLLKKNSRFGQLYKYVYPLMIALGASALFCDAVLHLLPEAFGLHGHSHDEAEADHADEGEDQTFVWKGCVVIAGTYFFFLFETILHTWNPQGHSHGADTVLPKNVTGESAGGRSAKTYGSTASAQGDTDKISLVESTFRGNAAEQDGGSCTIPTAPRSQRRESTQPGATVSIETRSTHSDDVLARMNCIARTWHSLLNIKPLAWLIIFGDAIHNFADGLALGAAITQSLSLGLSTTIALIFHEIPHELGDFVILLSTGMKWYKALFFTLLSQVTGIVAFFVGVVISTNSEEANSWILGIAAGIFLYISLVDLLPGLIHTKEKGRSHCGQFVMINLGFIIAFTALLLLAIFEEELNAVIDL